MKVPDNDVVIFTDGFDVFWTNTVYEVVGRFLEMKAEIVFAAEKYLWPNKHLRFPPAPNAYRYLNSGCFIGRVGELRKLLATEIHDSADDQLYLQHKFLSGQFDIKLDYEGYIFQTNSETVTIQKGVVFNSETRCYGCIYHGNGGKEAKERLHRLYNLLYIEEKYAKLEVSDYKVIGNEMLLVDFLTPSQCEEWIRLGNEHAGWATTFSQTSSHHMISTLRSLVYGMKSKHGGAELVPRSGRSIGTNTQLSSEKGVSYEVF